MNLRAGTAADAEAICRLISSFQRELTDHPDGVGAEQYLASVSQQAERDYLESSRYSFLVAEEGPMLVGFIALRDATHLFHLFVAREHQRRGIATLLWQEAKAQALRRSAISSFTVNSSLAAVPVYRSFGFQATAELQSVHGIFFLPMQLAVGHE